MSIRPESKPLPSLLAWARGLVFLACGICSLLTLLGFLGRFHWTLDLCSHFRVQYALALGLSGCLSLALRCPRAAFACLLMVGVNAVVVLSSLVGGGRIEAKGSPVLRVMLINVNTETGDPQRVKQAIQEADPDLLVLEEINDRWLEEFAWLKVSHPFSITRPRQDNFGLGLFSKQPLSDGKIVNLGVSVPSIFATTRFGGTPVQIVATHPPPPTRRAYARWRDQQLDRLPSSLGAPWPLILVGDLNVTPWNGHFRGLLRRSGLKDSARGFGYHPTWPNDNPFIRIPLDHILYSPGLSVVGRHVGGDVASDHFPVIADFVMEPKPAAR